MKKQHINDPIPDGVIAREVRGDEVTLHFEGDDYVNELRNQELAIQKQMNRYERKIKRSQELNCLTVTTVAGNVFNACENSQNRLARTIMVMDDVETLTWTLADNTPCVVNRSELKEALRLAIETQNAIWGIN